MFAIALNPSDSLAPAPNGTVALMPPTGAPIPFHQTSVLDNVWRGTANLTAYAADTLRVANLDGMLTAQMLAARHAPSPSSTTPSVSFRPT